MNDSLSRNTANTYELNDLHRGTLYQIYMRSSLSGSPLMAAINALSEPSDIITIRTKGESNT